MEGKIVLILLMMASLANSSCSVSSSFYNYTMGLYDETVYTHSVTGDLIVEGSSIETGEYFIPSCENPEKMVIDGLFASEITKLECKSDGDIYLTRLSETTPEAIFTKEYNFARCRYRVCPLTDYMKNNFKAVDNSELNTLNWNATVAIACKNAEEKLVMNDMELAQGTLACYEGLLNFEELFIDEKNLLYCGQKLCTVTSELLNYLDGSVKVEPALTVSETHPHKFSAKITCVDGSLKLIYGDVFRNYATLYCRAGEFVLGSREVQGAEAMTGAIMCRPNTCTVTPEFFGRFKDSVSVGASTLGDFASNSLVEHGEELKVSCTGKKSILYKDSFYQSGQLSLYCEYGSLTLVTADSNTAMDADAMCVPQKCPGPNWKGVYFKGVVNSTTKAIVFEVFSEFDYGSESVLECEVPGKKFLYDGAFVDSLSIFCDETGEITLGETFDNRKALSYVQCLFTSCPLAMTMNEVVPLEGSLMKGITALSQSDSLLDGEKATISCTDNTKTLYKQSESKFFSALYLFCNDGVVKMSESAEGTHHGEVSKEKFMCFKETCEVSQDFISLFSPLPAFVSIGPYEVVEFTVGMNLQMKQSFEIKCSKDTQLYKEGVFINDPVSLHCYNGEILFKEGSKQSEVLSGIVGCVIPKCEVPCKHLRLLGEGVMLNGLSVDAGNGLNLDEGTSSALTCEGGKKLFYKSAIKDNLNVYCSSGEAKIGPNPEDQDTFSEVQCIVPKCTIDAATLSPFQDDFKIVDSQCPGGECPFFSTNTELDHLTTKKIKCSDSEKEVLYGGTFKKDIDLKCISGALNVNEKEIQGEVKCLKKTCAVTEELLSHFKESVEVSDKRKTKTLLGSKTSLEIGEKMFIACKDAKKVLRYGQCENAPEATARTISCLEGKILLVESHEEIPENSDFFCEMPVQNCVLNDFHIQNLMLMEVDLSDFKKGSVVQENTEFKGCCGSETQFAGNYNVGGRCVDLKCEAGLIKIRSGECFHEMEETMPYCVEGCKGSDIGSLLEVASGRDGVYPKDTQIEGILTCNGKEEVITAECYSFVWLYKEKNKIINFAEKCKTQEKL